LPPKALFVSAGSGITPVMGMLRTWLPDLPDLPDVVVVHAARTPDDVLFGAELRRWDREGRIRLVERHTATDGRLDAADLAQLVPDVAERRTWVCGPNGLVDAVTAWFGEHGWSEHLHTERFRPVMSVVGEGGTVSFARSDRSVTADGATTLLDAGEQVGVLLPSGCRRGICYGCVVPLRQGAVRDVRTGTVTRAEPGDGVFVQTCVSAAAGPCTLDA
jgi:ferredoxin-NADP reductase